MAGFRQGLAVVLAMAVCFMQTAFGNRNSGGRAETKTGVSRCLVIGYDRFVSMPDTSPCSANNNEIMSALLADYAPEPVRIVRRVNEPGTAEILEELIRDTFREAGESDTSYLYISTHGVEWEEAGEIRMALILSDGTTEEALDPVRLRNILDEIPGEKVLILDACHSGAVIPVFEGAGYQILTSSAAAEDSFFWFTGREDGTGSGYFTSALESALRASRTEQIDPDGNGELSLEETLGRIAALYGASSPQGYSGGGGRMIFRLPETREVQERIRGLTFDPLIREEDILILPFHFTVTETTRIDYRIVTRKNGEWDFAHGTTMADRERTGTTRGMLSPGDKDRKIRITVENLGEEGTALLQIISHRGLHGQVPVLEGTWVISISE